MLFRIIPCFGLLIINIVLFALLYFVPGQLTIPEDIAFLVDNLPLLFFPAAWLLAWRFNRSRNNLALWVNGLFFVLFCLLPRAPWTDRAQLTSMLLYPLFMGLLTWKGERGLLSAPGIPWTVGTGVLWGLPVILWFLDPAYFTQFMKPAVDFMAAHGSWVFTVALSLGLTSCFISYLCRKTASELSLFFMTLFGYLAIKKSVGQVEVDVIYSEFLYLGAALSAMIGVVEGSHNLAYRDELTGVPGRRALIECMSQLGGQYALAMTDIDHFKKFNDTYGHYVGDIVLQKVSALLTTVGGGGKVFRYGGEEFAVVFAGLTSGEAAKYLDIVRQELASRVLNVTKPAKGQKPAKNCLVKITISMGVAMPDEYMKTPSSVLKGADKALYVAKENGRNQVVDYSAQPTKKKAVRKSATRKPVKKEGEGEKKSGKKKIS